MPKLGENYSGPKDQKAGAGSAAKYDAGKPELTLIPYAAAVCIMDMIEAPTWASSDQSDSVKNAFLCLSAYCNCMGDYSQLECALEHLTETYATLFDATAGLARSMMFGKNKYSRGNWRGGFDDSRMLDASMRHCLQWLVEKELDADSWNDHRDHALFGIAVVLDQIRRRAKGETVGADDIHA